MRERKQLRKPSHNYSSNGYYFVTICTKNREPWFGEISNCEMQLTNIGLICQKFWKEIPDHFADVRIDEFIIMPNHIHGILEIHNPTGNPTVEYPVGNNNYCSLPNDNKIPWQTQWGKSISSAIRGFKIGVTKWCKNNGYHEFAWQKSYYDRIIRNEKEYINIKNYIQNNPRNWDNYKLNVI